jgi:hypothetical protein
MDKILQLLETITKRPAMYVGTTSLRAVSHYLDGYCHALRDANNIEDPLKGWTRWIEFKYLISHPAWHWTRILIHIYGSDKAAIDLLPSLYKEFRNEVILKGVENIEKDLRDKLIQTYGAEYYQPENTNTKVWDE